MDAAPPAPEEATPSGGIRPLLATSRVANIPSVVSNVSLGVALGTIAGNAQPGPGLAVTWALLSLAGILLYVAGNFLNDWADRGWDAIHRPERALPSGKFRPAHFLLTAILTAAGGLVLAGTRGFPPACAALAILLFIAIYTRWHKATPWAVVPMGLCRALLIVLGAVGAGGTFFPLILPHATALLIYIAALSLSARYESSPNPPAAARFSSRFLLIASGLAMAAPWFMRSPLATLSGLLPFVIWLALSLSLFRRPVPAHVSALLAGIPLLDWIALIPLALVFRAADAPASLLAACFLIPPLAFVSGRLLQKLAPAT